jgi:hypothetical protein
MNDLFIKLLTVAYGAGGIVTFLGFMPTVRDLWNKKPSANTWTYIIWTTTTVLTSLYGFFVLQNLIFNIVINLQLAACTIVLILRVRLAIQTKNLKY